MAGPASGSRLRVEIVEAVSETFDSALELAEAFEARVGRVASGMRLASSPRRAA